jgi:hypothetical protein
MKKVLVLITVSMLIFSPMGYAAGHYWSRFHNSNSRSIEYNTIHLLREADLFGSAFLNFIPIRTL